MATKNIVPNADGEGQLGTSSKSWAQGHIDSITGTIATAAQGSITSLGTLTALSISGDLTVSGGDITLGAAATAGTLSLVASAHGAVGNSLTISGGSTTAGTTDNIAGGSLILTGGAGKGTGDGGSVIIKSATKGSSGSSLNAIDDTIATFASDLSTTFAGGVAVAGASRLPVSNSKNSAGIQIPTNAQLGFGNGATNKPDFGFAVQGTSGDAKLNIFCGTGGTAVDAFFDTNGFFNAAALKVANDGTIGSTGTASAITIDASGNTVFGGVIKQSAATSQLTLNDSNSDSSGSTNIFDMTDSSNNVLFKIAQLTGGLNAEINQVVNGNLAFKTNNTTRLTIENDGKVGIGDLGSTYSAQLFVIGSLASYICYFYNNGNGAGYQGIRINAGANDGSGVTNYLRADDGDNTEVGGLRNNNGTFELFDSSDETLKENIADTEIKGLDRINGLKVRKFNWKKSGILKEAGFVAQEVETVIPEASSAMDSGLLAVSTTSMVPTLVKAIQEQQVIIEDLKSRIEALEG